MMPDGVLDSFRARITEINDPDRLVEEMEDEFAEELPPADVAPILDFLRSDQGSRIVMLELSAREALLDPDIEAMTARCWTIAAQWAIRGSSMIEQFVEVNDLVDANVVGRDERQRAFYCGAWARAAHWNRPDRCRNRRARSGPRRRRSARSTEDWVYSFLLLAYGPLSDQDLAAYIAFSESEPGQAMNRALFAAFDRIFVDDFAGDRLRRWRARSGRRISDTAFRNAG